MAQNSKIEWCHHTFNPWWGCVKVSPECDSCYAETLAIRYGWSEKGSHFPIWGKDARRRFFGDKHWQEPLKWNRAALDMDEVPRVFCGSQCDVLEDRYELIPHRIRLVETIGNATHLNWLLLSKRPQNFTRLFPWSVYPSNVWAMTTVGCKSSLWRIDALREVPARVRGLSCEPLLEDLGRIELTGIHWVIVGGESGHGARPCNIDWIRSLVRQCRDSSVAVFVKQLGAKPKRYMGIDGALELQAFAGTPLDREYPMALRDRKGGDMGEWPDNLRVREIPGGGE